MATTITPGLRPPTATSTGAAAPTSAPAAPAPPAAPATPERQADSYAETGQAAPQQAPQAPAGSLTSKLGQVLDPKGLAKQLAYDLLTQHAALFGAATTTRDVKAARLMEFVVPYAQRFAELKQGTPLDPARHAELVQKLLQPLLAAGLGHVIELKTQRTGPEVARELLRAESPDDVSAAMAGLRFDSTDPAGLIAQPLQAQATPVLRQARVAEADAGEEKASPLNEKAVLHTPSWGAWGRFRSDLGRAFDDFKWKTGDRLLVGVALGALAIAMLVAALLSLLR